MLATGQAKAYPGSIGILQFLLSWLADSGPSSEQLLTAARFVMVEIFWLNVVLLALATGANSRSIRGLLVLLGAATLAPLWDYGFEIRHDNLLYWIVSDLVRCAEPPAGLQSYLIAGALAVAMQFAAHKAFAYFIPLTLAILLFPPGHNQPRWKLAFFWGVGGLMAFVALKSMYVASAVN